MCRKILLLLLLTIGLYISTARAAVRIEVENYSFEIPDDGRKHDIDVDTPGVVTGWARTDPTTSAGREFGWQATDGEATGFMGNDAVIYNLTDFIIQTGDEFQMIFDTKVTWAANNMRAQLYYDDEGDRVAVASTDVDLTDFPGWPNNSGTNWGTYTVDFNAVYVPASADHKIGIQFHHIRTSGDDSGGDNIWAGLDFIELKLTSPLIRAQNPSPVNESEYDNANVPLAWTPGPNAPDVDSYHVYLSENRDDVSAGAPDADKGTTGIPELSIEGLIKGLTYYWRVDTVIGADTYRGNIWQFTVTSVTAYNPNPRPGTNFVPLEKALSWSAGSGAVEGHALFFGEDFNDVIDAPLGISGPAPFVGLLAPSDTNWAPEDSGMTFETNKTYYWRVDEVESSDFRLTKIHKGEVWSFTTVPIKGLGSITRNLYTNIMGLTVADLTSDVNFPDNPSSTEELLTFEAPHMSIVNYGSRVHGWLYVRNSGEYTFWIASGENSQLWLGSHPSTVTMIASVDSEEGRAGWTQPREYDKYPEIQQSEPIYLEGGGSVYYIMVLHKKGWGYDNISVAWSGPDSNDVQQIIPGTSLIRFDAVTLVTAGGPAPFDNATETSRTPILSWVPGAYAKSHEIYFGTDEEAVLNATKDSAEYKGPTDTDSFAPGNLEFGTTYYWRIDEVNDANPDSPWIGNVWSFTTGNFVVVDHFEDYNDYPPFEVWNTWIDGYDDPTNGSTAGYPDPDFLAGEHYLEDTIVRSGNFSMPVIYDNSAGISEVTRTFSSSQRNWTRDGVVDLGLWYRGYPASVGSFTEGPAGTYTMAASGGDIWGTADEFHFAYKQLTGPGTIIAKVESVQETDPWAKAGVMIRNTLEPGSKHAMMVVTPSSGVSFQHRTLTDAESNDTTEGEITAPYWVKLELTSSGSFIASYSANGTSWTQLDSVEITMNATLYTGLALTSHNNSATCEAVFSHVSITGNVSQQPWMSQDIGITSNVAEPMYVELNGNAIVYNDNPDAALMDEWTLWRIDLQEFASQGVNLTSVNSLTIGFGNKTNPTAGGSGLVYFDDIRLYRP
jgi:hypothetical protein